MNYKQQKLKKNKKEMIGLSQKIKEQKTRQATDELKADQERLKQLEENSQTTRETNIIRFKSRCCELKLQMITNQMPVIQQNDNSQNNLALNKKLW